MLTVLMSMVSTTASAYDFEAGGIYYNILTSTTVAVTYSGSSYEENPGRYTGSVAIPAEVTNGDDTYQVVEIEMGAFWKCTGLTAVTLPCTLKTFGDCAFAYCSSLTSVTLPRGLENLGIATFSGCSMLKTVTALMSTPPAGPFYMMEAPESCKLYVRYGTRDAYVAADGWKTFAEIIEMEIPSSAIIFEDALTENLCVREWDTDNDGYLSAPEAAAVKDLGTVFKGQPITAFKELAFFINLTSISERAFGECTSLKSIGIPDKVTTIGNFAFKDCSILTSVTLPSGVSSIGYYAFAKCSKLSSINIPNGVTTIGTYAFSNCSSLTSLSLPNGITTLSDYVFGGCVKLASINIPNGVTSLGRYAFWDCHSLTSIAIPNSVVTIDDVAFGKCYGLTSVSIPNSLTTIANGAFEDCYGLTSVSIPNSVTSIGEWAFDGCSGLTSVVIGSSVKTIGKDAFPDVDEGKLSDIYCLGKTAPSAADAFSGTLSKIKLHIPAGGLYYNQEPWKSMTQDYEQICATPTYSLVGSTLKFECDTPGVTYHYKYTVEGENADHLDTGGKCTVTFYAKKAGYTDSNPVTAVVDMPATLKGDVNLDGKVTITDAVNVVDIILAGE